MVTNSWQNLLRLKLGMSLIKVFPEKFKLPFLHLFDFNTISPIKAAKKEANNTLIFEAIITSAS